MSPTDSLSLANKVAIITGSGRENGIGAGIALSLARAGARVTINYVSESTAPRAAEVVRNIEAAAGKGSVICVQADVSTAEGVKKLVQGTLDGFKVDHIDILVNNAVWSKPGPILQAEPADIIKSFEVTVYGPLYLMQATVPHMPRGGRIINIGTVATKIGLGGIPLYVATKSAIDALTWSTAEELGRGKGITINTVAPGPVLTDSLPSDDPGAQALKDHLVSRTRAEERPGTVDDIANVVLFVASGKSGWLTGQWISASGGITGN